MELIDYIWPLILVLARITAFIAVCPTLVPESVPARVRALACFGLALALSQAVPHSARAQVTLPGVAGELLIGAMMGMSLRLVAQGIGFAGELLDIQLGFGFARILNPMLGEEMGPVMHLCQWLGGLFFFSIGGLSLMVRGLLGSFVTMPAGSLFFEPRLSVELIERLGEMMAQGALIALPVVTTMVLVQVALAFLSKMAQQLNIWSIGMLGTMSLGLMVLWCNSPALGSSVAALWQSEGPRSFEVFR